MSTELPHDLRHRMETHRTDIQRTQHLLDVHARDLMGGSGSDLDAIARVQLVKAHLEAASIALGHALTEADRAP